MIIELAGVSGVGKSTVMRALIGQMRLGDLAGMSLGRAARRSPLSEEDALAQSERKNKRLFDIIANGHAGQIATLRTFAASWERAMSAGGDIIALVDEGFAHRLAYICADLTSAHFDAAYALAPRPAHLFVLNAPDDIITSRSILRRLPPAQAAAAAEREQTAPLHLTAAKLLNRAKEQTQTEGANAWDIDATQPPRRAARDMLACIAQRE